MALLDAKCNKNLFYTGTINAAGLDVITFVARIQKEGKIKKRERERERKETLLMQFPTDPRTLPAFRMKAPKKSRPRMCYTFLCFFAV